MPEGHAGTVYVGRRARLSDATYDFCVIGGGIYGLSTALFLRQRWPRKRVLVIEDNTIPGECITVNTGGIIRACYSDPDVMAVSHWGRRYYQKPREAMEIPFDLFAGFLPDGWIRVRVLLARELTSQTGIYLEKSGIAQRLRDRHDVSLDLSS